MNFTDLRYIFDECDAQFNVWEVVQVGEPGDDMTHSHKECDEGKQPHQYQQHCGYTWHTLISSLQTDMNINLSIPGLP